MRLGAYPCIIQPGTAAAAIYGATQISERHRHRYEVSNAHRERLEEAGLVLSGLSPDKRLVEMVELGDHPHFVGCQFHPEFKSRPFEPHPLFTHFVHAAVERRNRRAKDEALGRAERKDSAEDGAARAGEPAVNGGASAPVAGPPPRSVN